MADTNPITHALKTEARREDDATATAIKGMSPEQQKEFLALSPAERAKRLTELKKPKVKTLPVETVMSPKPKMDDYRDEKGVVDLRAYNAALNKWNQASIKQAKSRELEAER